MDIKLILDIARTKQNPNDIGVLAKTTISDEVVQEFQLQWKIEKGKCELVSTPDASKFITSLDSVCKIACCDTNEIVQSVQEAVESVDGKFCEMSDETSLGVIVISPIRRVITVSEPQDCSLSKKFASSKEFGFLKNLHESLDKVINHDLQKEVEEISVDINFVSDNIKEFDFIKEPVFFPEVYEVYNLNYCITYTDNSQFRGNYRFATTMTLDEEKMGNPLREEEKFNLFLKKARIDQYTAGYFECFIVPFSPKSCMATFRMPPKNTLFLIKEESSPQVDVDKIHVNEPKQIENSTTVSPIPFYLFFPTKDKKEQKTS